MPEMLVGSYRLVAPLGRGGTAEVWRAVHVERGTAVAVKLVDMQDPVTRRAFASEVRAIAALEHPNIVRVHDQGEVSSIAASASHGRLTAGQPWLVMELATSGTLGQLRGRLDWTGVRHVCLALLDALGHAHARGILHRDLKPGNVLIGGERPGPKLADFGLAWVLAGARPDAGAHLSSGTPTYMAPEQIAGAWRDFGPWTDLYALGATCWRILTGRAPFPGNHEQVLRGHLSSPLPAFVPEVPAPPEIEAILRQMLEKAPQRRFGSAAEVHAAISALPRNVEDGARSVTIAAPVDETTMIRPSWSAASSFATLPPRSPVPLPSERRTRRQRRSEVLPGLGLFGLRTLPIVGRDGVDALLWERLAQVDAEGRPRVVVLTGPAGQGKGRIASRVAERAHETAGLVHVRVRHAPVAGPGDGLVAALAEAWHLAGLAPDEATARIDTLVPTLDPEARRAVARALTGADGLDHPNDRHAALARAMRLLGGGRAVVLLVEDVQWGAEVLAFLVWLADSARHGDPEPVLAVITVQTDALEAGGGAEYLLTSLKERPNAEVHRLGPIPDRRELVDAVLPLEEAVADAIAGGARGDPSAVAQIVADLVESDALEPRGDRYGLRDGYAVMADPTASVLRRVDRAIGPGEGVAVELAALLGLRVDPREWRAACARLGAPASDDLVERLLRQGLVRGTAEAWAFRDTQVRQAVLGRAAERVKALHLACAEAFEALGVAPARIGRHRLAAGDLDGALEPMLVAAEDLFDRRQFGGLFDLVEPTYRAALSLSLPESDPRLARIRTLAAEMVGVERMHAEQIALAEQAAAQAHAHGWPEIEVRAWQVASRRLLRSDRAKCVVASLAAVRVAGASPRTHLRALAHHGHMTLNLVSVAEGRAWYARARALLPAVRDPLGHSWIDAGEAMIAFHARDTKNAVPLALAALERSLAAGSLTGACEAYNLLGNAALDADDLVAAERHYRGALHFGGLAGTLYMSLQSNLTQVVVQSGRFTEGLHLGTRFAERAQALADPHCQQFASALLWACHAGLGDRDAWDALDPDAWTSAQTGPAPYARVAAVAGDAWWAAAEPARAHRAWTFALSLWRLTGRDQPIRDLEERLARQAPEHPPVAPAGGPLLAPAVPGSSTSAPRFER